MTQEGFTLLEVNPVEYVRPHRHQRFREAGSIYHVHAVWNGEKRAFVDRRKLGIATPGEKACNPVAGLESAGAI